MVLAHFSHFTLPNIVLIIPILGFAVTTRINSIAYAAWATTYHTSSLIGIFAALSSTGGFIGGLIYGKLKVTNSISQKLYFAMPIAVGFCVLPMLITHSIIIAALTAFCAGIVMTPIFIEAFLRVPKTFHKRYYNEANSFIGTTYNIGSGVGSLFAGILVNQNMLYIIFMTSFFIPLAVKPRHLGRGGCQFIDMSISRVFYL